jgi:hydroxyethylthiazole kinase-like uncharacterized protein yjeF
MNHPGFALANQNDLRFAAPTRKLYSSKHDNGNVAIIGGSDEIHGAPVLASNAAYSMLAALRVGTGYVTGYVPRSILKEVRCLSPDTIIRPLKGSNLSPSDVVGIIKGIGHSDSIVLGSGIGKRKETMKAVIRLVDYAKGNGKRMVIDADGIHALSLHQRLSMNFIITPNGSEFQALFKKRLDEKNLSGRIKAAIAVSRLLNCNILLKGHETVITDGRRTKIVRSKSSSLATMGTGDVLAGIIGAFAANNKNMFTVGVAGAYLHSRIGDLLYKEKGNHILATDVIDYIPKILKKFDNAAT